MIRLREKRQKNDITETEIKEELKKIKSYIFDDIQSPYDFLNQSPEDLLNTLFEMNLIDKNEIPDLENKLADEKFRSWLLNELKGYIDCAPKYQNYIYALISLAGLFSSHWESARYPTENISPSELFDENNLIIIYLSDFQKLTNKLIDGFENLKL